RYPSEVVVPRSVGRGDDGPSCPVPMLGERLVGIVADSPAIRRRSTRHIMEVIEQRGGGRGDDGPHYPVPMLDGRWQGGMVFGGAGEVTADGPAIRRRSVRYPKEVVGVAGAGVRRGDNGPRCPVPVLGERVAEGILADGPAIRRRSARHIKEFV